MNTTQDCMTRYEKQGISKNATKILADAINLNKSAKKQGYNEAIGDIVVQMERMREANYTFPQMLERIALMKRITNELRISMDHVVIQPDRVDGRWYSANCPRCGERIAWIVGEQPHCSHKYGCTPQHKCEGCRLWIEYGAFGVPDCVKTSAKW